MISSAISKTFIMAIIILIIHFSLKHILYDKTTLMQYNTNQYPVTNTPHVTETETETENEGDNQVQNQKNERREREVKGGDKSNKSEALEHFINQGFAADASFGMDNDKVSFQKPKPFIDPNVSIRPKSRDVDSFILEGEKGHENSELLNSKQHPVGSFFKHAHVPQGIANPEKQPKNVQVRNDGVYVDPNSDMNPYNSSLFKTTIGDKFLFQDVTAINEDNDNGGGLDEVFKQTQIKN